MPPKKAAVVKKPEIIDSDSESEDMPRPQIQQKPKEVESLVIKTPMILKSSGNDSDRIQLAHAINNLNLKADQFMDAMKGFDSFRQEIAQLDVKMQIKKSEYNQNIEHLENEYNRMKKNLEESYEELTKKLDIKYKDLNRNIENEYNEKNKELQNNFKNTQIEVKQKLSEFKIKACEEVAKEFNMLVIRNEEYGVLKDNVSKANRELSSLQQTFNDQCNSIRNEEKTKYNDAIKIQTTTNDLNNKAILAELKAQVEQQKKEISVLNNTIDSLKHELAEQRSLTKEVAQAGAKAQITQNLSSKN